MLIGSDASEILKWRRIFALWQLLEVDSAKCGDVRPLGLVEQSTIRHNMSSLVELMEPDHGLLAELYSRYCINRLLYTERPFVCLYVCK